MQSSRIHLSNNWYRSVRELALMRPRNVRTGQQKKQKKNKERKRAFCVKLVMGSLEDKCDELMQNLPVSFVSESFALLDSH